jgi:hypothetical protein
MIDEQLVVGLVVAVFAVLAYYVYADPRDK